MMGSSIFQLLLSSILLCTFLQEPTLAIKKSYIVYLGGHSHGSNPSSGDLESATNYHYGLLASVLGSHEKAKEAIMYSYNRHINGFAAVLEVEEATEIAKNPNVVSVFKSREHRLHTTRSWDFLGLEKNGIITQNSAWRKGRFGQDTIIANLDSGVWPEHPSFNDRGMGPVPSKWRGGNICQIRKLNGSKKVPCNRKLIGARFFSLNYEAEVGQIEAEHRSARDFQGHGTHTLAIAGGNFVRGASVFNNGNGTAKGGSPRARVVSYKVCWSVTDPGGCHEADMLKAFDIAINDGVDVISVSVGGNRPSEEAMFTDAISIGAFHAVAKGIVVVCSAGNDGPALGTVTNVAPWSFTVAASTIDREFVSNISLGNRQYLKGASLNTGLRPRKFYSVINSVDAKLANATTQDARLCKPGTLDPNKVRGKLLVCVRGGKIRSVGEGDQARIAGAVGMLEANDDQGGNTLIAEPHILPASSVDARKTKLDPSKKKSGKSENSSIMAYMTRARTDIGTKPAPVMASFSSRGPSAIQPLILKPDVTAPGLDILSAYSLGTSPTNLPSDSRKIPFNVLAGTSQSCPHVSGIAGLLKTLHPDWSPAAIKSAIMTTSTTLNKTNGPILDQFDQIATPLDYGSGHIRPNLAMDPGLVYDLTTFDYLNFVCASGYTQDLRILYNHKPYACPNPIPKIEDFNYPSITVRDLPINVTRKLTNVGPPSTYSVNTHVRTRGLKILVQPNSLTFKKTGETKTFQVILQSTGASRPADDQFLFGELSWIDGKHTVRSPIVVLAASTSTTTDE